MSVNQRKYFRLAYPITMMPRICISDREYLVSEISEGGVRLRCLDKREFHVGDQVTGELVFPDGNPISIEGIVLRHDQRDFVIAPIEGISFKRVVLEQRRVLSECPSVHVD